MKISQNQPLVFVDFGEHLWYMAYDCLIKGMDGRNIVEITDLTVEQIELLKTGDPKENAERR